MCGKAEGKAILYPAVVGRYTQQYPKQFAHGEQASFLVSFQAAPNWATEFATGFLEDPSEKNLKTLRGMINTSVGQSIELVPEANLLKKLRSAHAD